MKITQIRNATIIVEFGDAKILVDPMLARAGRIPALKYFTRRRRRNPLVDIPENGRAALEDVTHCLITHCQKGHFDHLDRAGVKWLRQRRIPVFCTVDDAGFLEGFVTPIPCVHGRGVIGKFMAHGHGYFIEWPGEPSLYIAGDTVLTDDVRQCLARHRPQVSVVPAGGARFDLGGEVIMDAEQVIEFCRLSEGRVVANHLEALDHCPVSRDELARKRLSSGLDTRLMIPRDGETLLFGA
jgi:L-ascorbate metabolism protein UlaG (beta-lactamase superfamily)